MTGLGSLGPIRWGAINDWARRFHIEGDDFDRLVEIIYHMDEVFLKHVMKKK